MVRYPFSKMMRRTHLIAIFGLLVHPRISVRLPVRDAFSFKFRQIRLPTLCLMVKGQRLSFSSAKEKQASHRCNHRKDEHGAGKGAEGVNASMVWLPYLLQHKR